MLILGIESSCDDTCAAVVKDGREILSNVAATSAAEQNIYGGIVPEIASRRHIESISDVVNAALQNANVTINDIDAIAFTFAPGLIGALLVGVNFAKGLGFSAQKPLVAVHHLRGHIAALYLTHQELKPPFICLVASGGHSHIINVESYTSFKVLGRTVDDAAGEAFDKVSRTLGLGYPGGPAVSKAAKSGNIHGYTLPTPKVEGMYDVSFSGLKTAVLNIINKAKMQGEEINVADMAASFEYRISEILAQKLLLAAENTHAEKICIAGGVAANTVLREILEQGAKKLNAKLYLPQIALCGDNAAIIASQGFYEYEAGHRADYAQNGYPTLPIDYID
ncbi:MAG: tRNA (adenosine(37)-N6)-threonylcarbamoyltransferase complex transferase subunit TsaD [Oscillospiraceae bacterium]